MSSCSARRSAALTVLLTVAPFVGAAFSARPVAAEPTLVRGPYLQSPTPTSMVVCWRTSEPADARVLVEPVSGGPLQAVTDPAIDTEHEILLYGLDPATEYSYSVGTIGEVFAGPSASGTFRTPPSTGSRDPLRVWVLGDSGTADANAAAVRDAFDGWNGDRRVDVWMMLGDNAYTDGTDAEYQAAVFDMYAARLRTTPLLPTFGNHDGHSADSPSQTGVYFDIFRLPASGEAGGVASGTEAYYSFDHGNVHFVTLDSHGHSRWPEGAMLTWLTQDLDAAVADPRTEWIVVYWHHPPYSKGSHDSDTETALIEMREHALPILEQHGVDLVLSGHSHSYERSVLLAGHYGDSTTLQASMVLDPGDGDPAGDGAYEKRAGALEGTVYTVAGSSGKVNTASLSVHPIMAVVLPRRGSLVLDIEGSRLDGTFVADDGAVLDHFVVVRPLFADAFESGDVSGWTSSGL